MGRQFGSAGAFRPDRDLSATKQVSAFTKGAERYNGLPKNRGADMKYQSAAPNKDAPDRRRRRFFLRPSVVLCANGANVHLKLITELYPFISYVIVGG